MSQQLEQLPEEFEHVQAIVVDPANVQTLDDLTEEDLDGVLASMDEAIDTANCLQQLRDEFRAAFSAADRDDQNHMVGAWRNHDIEWFADFHDYHPDEVLAMRQISRRYVIARDFGVFDPKEADMLWKLQNQ